MDIDIDCASLYYGINNLSSIETSLSDLSSALGGITLDGELTTAGLITKAISTVNNISNTTIPNVKRKLTNAKNILINMDSEAALFFQYIDTGLLDENLNFTDVPLYDQRDYPNIPYSQGSVATSGCGLTAMCMALSYIYNDIITPAELGRIANSSSSNNEGRMMGAAKAVGATVTRTTGIYANELRRLLKEGKQVICLVRNGGHFVLCKGVTDDGRILVNDPYGAWAKTTPYTEAELNKSGGTVWVVDPYANVGNAKTSIGRVKVSSAVTTAIKEANSGSGTVSITSKQYKEGVAEATAAKKAKNWKSIIGPTAIELQGGNQRIGGRVSSGSSSAAAEQLATDTEKETDDSSSKNTGTNIDANKTGTNDGGTSYNDGGYTYSGGNSGYSGGSSNNYSSAASLEGALAMGPKATKVTTEKITEPVVETTTSTKETSTMSDAAKIFAKNNEILSRNKNTAETNTTKVVETTTNTQTSETTPVSTTSNSGTTKTPEANTEPIKEPVQEVQQTVQTQNEIPKDLNIDAKVVQTDENTAVIGSKDENIQNYTPEVEEKVPNPEPEPVEQTVSTEPEPSSILNNYHQETNTESNVVIEEPLNPRETETVQRPNDPVVEKTTEENVIEEKVPNPTVEEQEENTTRQPVINNENEDGELEEYDAEEMYERNKPDISDEPTVEEKSNIIKTEPESQPHKKTNNVATAVLTVGAIAGAGAASYAAYKAIKNKQE